MRFLGLTPLVAPFWRTSASPSAAPPPIRVWPWRCNQINARMAKTKGVRVAIRRDGRERGADRLDDADRKTAQDRHAERLHTPSDRRGDRRNHDEGQKQ